MHVDNLADLSFRFQAAVALTTVIEFSSGQPGLILIAFVLTYHSGFASYWLFYIKIDQDLPGSINEPELNLVPPTCCTFPFKLSSPRSCFHGVSSVWLSFCFSYCNTCSGQRSSILRYRSSARRV
jgi:hypothetical protein